MDEQQRLLSQLECLYDEWYRSHIEPLAKQIPIPKRPIVWPEPSPAHIKKMRRKLKIMRERIAQHEERINKRLREINDRLGDEVDMGYFWEDHEDLQDWLAERYRAMVDAAEEAEVEEVVAGVLARFDAEVSAWIDAELAKGGEK